MRQSSECSTQEDSIRVTLGFVSFRNACAIIFPVYALCAAQACTFNADTEAIGLDDASNSALDATAVFLDGQSAECASTSDGKVCSTGVCLGGSCRSDSPVELAFGLLSIHDTDSTTATAEDSLDDNRNTRWRSSPDTLPLYLSYRLDQPYYVAGVRVDAGGWSHCGQSAVSLSMDGITWEPPIATYTGASPLVENVTELFGAVSLAEFVKIDVKARTDGGSYCYIGEFRVTAYGL